MNRTAMHLWGRPIAWLLVLVFACLVAFMGKAVHIEDTLFLKVAQQVGTHPGDFYGFKMNWYGSTRPMVENFDNPPLACYYLALLGWLGGWSELVLHLGMAVPALAAAAGIFFLARNLTGRPAVATLMAVATPVFMVSATTLMCDLLLLALWIWSLVLFEEGLRKQNWTNYLLSGVCAGLAFYTKFSALALVPLLLAYGAYRERRLGAWLLTALTPLLFAAGYEGLTFLLYGKGLLLTASGVSRSAIPGGSTLGRYCVGLAFLGGCFLPTLFLAPWLWSLRGVLKGLCLIAPCLFFYPYLGVFSLLWGPDGRPDWLLCLQSALFITAGLHILLLAIADFWEHRDAASLLLLLWVLGIYTFTTVFNWTLNARSLLPMAGAVGVLVARRLEKQAKTTRRDHSLAIGFTAGSAVALSLWLAAADYGLANTGRMAASDVCARYQAPGRTLWFEGHWGFQYYMEQRGARALERDFSGPVPGEFVVVPSEAVNLFDFPTNLVRLRATLEYPSTLPCTTMNCENGAGFYAATAGPLPWMVGRISPQRYYVFEVTSSVVAGGTRAAGHGALLEQFEFERKIRVLRNTVRRNPANIVARLHLARIAEEQCRQPEAISLYREVLRMAPDSDQALSQLAWILATSNDDGLRNGKDAVELAVRADELTNHKSPAVLTTLSAAYAEQGRFGEAVRASQGAMELARMSNQAGMVSQNEALLQLYEANQPFRQ